MIATSGIAPSPGLIGGRPPGPFRIRGINVCESLSRHRPGQVQRLLDRLVQWRMNTLVVHPQYGYREHSPVIREFCRDNGIDLVQYLYSFLAFTPNAAPGVFAVARGGHPHFQSVQCETRLCATNPDARREFREGVRRYLNEGVEPGDHLLLATADGLLLCECEGCRTLDAVGQWQPFLEIAVEEILRCGKPVTTHFLAYIGRFRPPDDMGIFQHIDAVMFDTHLRHRWLPLGVRHKLGPVERVADRHDPEARNKPVNIYLLEKLTEWRNRYQGRLYVFENLMIQSCFSLPQPNTAALLQDQQTFRDLRIDGVVYEAFEPGIGAFEEQLEHLSRGLMGDHEGYRPSELETICSSLEGPENVRKRVLEYLFAPECQPRERLALFLGRNESVELAVQIRDYLTAPDLPKLRQLVGLALAHRDEWDWFYIVYRLATYLPAEQRPPNPTPAQARLFATPKPWDFLEAGNDPQEAMLALAQSLAQEDHLNR